jgi:hypothetical protein
MPWHLQHAASAATRLYMAVCHQHDSNLQQLTAEIKPSSAQAQPASADTCTTLCRDLSNNAFHGSLPSVWSNLTSLDFVDISRNQLTGPLPAAFSAWDAMQVRCSPEAQQQPRRKLPIGCLQHCSDVHLAAAWTEAGCRCEQPLQQLAALIATAPA